MGNKFRQICTSFEMAQADTSYPPIVSKTRLRTPMLLIILSVGASCCLLVVRLSACCPSMVRRLSVVCPPFTMLHVRLCPSRGCPPSSVGLTSPTPHSDKEWPRLGRGALPEQSGRGCVALAFTKNPDRQRGDVLCFFPFVFFARGSPLLGYRSVSVSFAFPRLFLLPGACCSTTNQCNNGRHYACLGAPPPPPWQLGQCELR